MKGYIPFCAYGAYVLEDLDLVMNHAGNNFNAQDVCRGGRRRRAL